MASRCGRDVLLAREAYLLVLPTLVLLYLAGSVLGVRLAASQWLEMTGLILVGLVPFVAIGFVVGYLMPVDALLDIQMPGIDGLAVAAVLAQEVPYCRSLILTTFGRPGYLRRAMEAGACGFVVKDAPPEQLADAIRRVAAGQRVVDTALAATTLAAGVSPLTARERDVLVAAKPGATVAEIAEKLFLSEGTVRNYLSAAIAKTGTRNRTEAVRTADELGWL